MTVSESTKKDLKKWGIKNVEVIHNGVTLPKRSPKIKKNNQKTLMFLGALAQDKGVFDVVEVFNILHKTHPNWKFWIVGKGTDEILKELKQLSNDNIEYFGYVDEDKKFELLSQAHILVNPSIREGWGLVNIEANSVGTPVVGYKVAGMVDSVKDGETGILVTPSVTNMVKAIEKLLDSKNYDNFSKNAQKWAGEFDWKKSNKYTTNLIYNLLEF